MGTFKAPASPADKTGYTFAGWTDVKGSTRVIYKTLDDIKPTSSKDYYPVYTPNSYTVRFYSDSDLLGDYVEQSFTYDAEQALKMNTFTSPTGDFKNWKDAADGSKTYENGQTVKVERIFLHRRVQRQLRHRQRSLKARQIFRALHPARRHRIHERKL